MGYYIKFISKELTLRKDNPPEVFNFLNESISNGTSEIKFGHKFFTLERHENIFMSSYSLKEKPYLKSKGLNWKLRIACDINYGREEILEFAKWITPYIAGHKPKEFIGELTGEDEGDRENIYLERTINVKKYQNDGRSRILYDKKRCHHGS